MQGVGGSSPLSPTIVVKRFLHFAETVFLWILAKLYYRFAICKMIERMQNRKNMQSNYEKTCIFRREVL